MSDKIKHEPRPVYACATGEHARHYSSRAASRCFVKADDVEQEQEQPKLATIENMREHYEPGVLAYSPLTGEEYSANPGDYFWLPESTPLTDSLGEPMVLVTRRTQVVPVRAR